MDKNLELLLSDTGTLYELKLRIILTGENEATGVKGVKITFLATQNYFF